MTTGLAPAYVALLPRLAEVARQHGYALAVHGSLQRDLDLIAVPWVDTASPAEIMVGGMVESLNATLRPHVEDKPHGRRAWSIRLKGGAYVDLSVMPRQP